MGGVLLFAFAISASFSSAAKPADKGFDEFGYNYTANLFSGKADGVDRNLDNKVWGDPTYANDHLVMKWSKAWDEARFNGEPWTCDAWENNEWNGASPNGSGEVWHYKIAWVGPEKFNVSGEWKLVFNLGGLYPHTMTITSFDQNTGEFSGTGVYDTDPLYTWTVTGKVDGNKITYTIVYTGTNAGYTVDAVGTISSDGKILDGTWSSIGQNGTWTGSGEATQYNICGREGGERVWGDFLILMDQGTADGVHEWLTHAIPSGYGMAK